VNAWDRIATAGRAAQALAPFNGKQAVMAQHNVATQLREPWNKGNLIGRKSALKRKEISAIRIRLQPANST
jgi:hypothetical protein